MTAKAILAASAACLMLAACSKGEAPAPGPSDSAAAIAAAASEAAATAEPRANEIPAAMQGRWGLVAADCSSTTGDAKGLLEIGPMNLKFFESIARLMNVAEDSKTHIKASFSWSGEGSDWDGDATLDLKDGGKTLVLAEQGAKAPAPQTYVRCP